MSRYTLKVDEKVTILGNVASSSLEIDADNLAGSSPVIPAAKTGTLTTRTSTTVGTLTMSAGHGFITGDKIDLFFANGQRSQVVVGTVATNSVPITGGAGDDLPALNAAITAMVPVSETLGMTGANVVAIHIAAGYKGFVTFTQADGTLIKTYKFTDEGVFTWFDDSTLDNPVMGANPVTGVTVGKVLHSHSDSARTHSHLVSVFHN